VVFLYPVIEAQAPPFVSWFENDFSRMEKSAQFAY